jgi:hypothetical protein
VPLSAKCVHQERGLAYSGSSGTSVFDHASNKTAVACNAASELLTDTLNTTDITDIQVLDNSQGNSDIVPKSHLPSCLEGELLHEVHDTVSLSRVLGRAVGKR